MKNISKLVAPSLLAASAAYAQGGSTLASTMEVYAFPEEGQEADQQSTEHIGRSD